MKGFCPIGVSSQRGFVLGGFVLGGFVLHPEQTLVALDEIQVHVMQKSVVHLKWPNVVHIYGKRADAIKRSYSSTSSNNCWILF